MAEKINALIWGTPTVCLLLITGIVYTFKLKFIQFRMFPYMIRKLRSGKDIRPQLKTSCLSLGAAMGTGNITGVASALSIGGAGAVFWMWVSAFLGMAIVYAENSLSASYSDSSLKGPMAYLEKGIGSRLLAAFFAIRYRKVNAYIRLAAIAVAAAFVMFLYFKYDDTSQLYGLGILAIALVFPLIDIKRNAKE